MLAASRSRRCCCLARRLLGGCRYYSGPYVYGPVQEKIGTREIVGHGMNGEPKYIDVHALPFPAIRFRECNPDIMALREKKRGDWRKLSCDEKKCLYRASFRQTFAELDAPTTEWKSIVGTVLFVIALSYWMFYWQQAYVHTDWPKSFDRESRIEQYYRAVAINNAPFRGNPRPPGAELRIHPKNKEMLDQIMSSQ